MTCDTDEGGDPIKIEISEDNEYKRFFENGLGALLSDPNFLLLYVPKNGVKMQVIRPASDSYHRRRMIKRINAAAGIPSFYYALSHLWGITESNRCYWNDISEYVDDEDGQPVKPISMRPEKRNTLLALLRDHPDSYWWIDVLCAHTETPLDIMGNIYACCLECIAMTDCEPDLISQLHLMGDIKEKNPQLLDDALAAGQCYKQYCQLTASLYKLIQSRWWKRVWTWQEMALPFGEVRLMAETGTHKNLSSTITVDELIRNYKGMRWAAVRIESRYRNIKRSERSKEPEGLLMRMLEWETTLLDWYNETSVARAYNTDRMQGNDYFYTLLLSFGISPRRCMDPVDYVYGVLGIFQIEIPRMDDPDALWELFISKMDKCPPSARLSSYTSLIITNRGYEVDLRKAKYMADVYKSSFKLLLKKPI